jgi:hypothetical protein
VLIISDLHWRCDTPAWRREEDYAKQVLRPQLASLLDTGEHVIVCGDVFHRAADFAATYDLFTFLKERRAVLYAVRGQHDMLNHNDTQVETGFNLLVEAGLIRVLGPDRTGLEEYCIRGMGWGEEMPPDGDILIAHVSVSHGDAIIPGATTATAFRQKASAFQLVFTGDNHKRFCIRDVEFSGVYNAGCFHQMSSDLVDQPPAAWHVMRNGEVFLFPIPFLPPMIDESYMLGQKKGKHAVAGAEFVKALAEARSHGGGDIFLDTLLAALAEAEGAIKELLGEVVRKCKEVHT